MGLFDFLKSDDEKRAEKREQDLLWANRAQAETLRDGGEGVGKSELMQLVDSARVAANAVKGRKDPDEVRAIIESAWGQQVSRIHPPPGLAEKIYGRIISRSVPIDMRAEMAGNVFSGLYDEEKTDAAPAPPVSRPVEKPTTPRPPSDNGNFDGSGEVDEEDLAYIRAQPKPKRRRR